MNAYKLNVDMSQVYKKELGLEFTDDYGTKLEVHIAPIPGLTNMVMVSAIEDGERIVTNRIVGLAEYFFSEIADMKYQGDFFLSTVDKSIVELDVYKLSNGIFLVSVVV